MNMLGITILLLQHTQHLDEVEIILLLLSIRVLPFFRNTYTFTQDSLFNSNELLSMRVLPFLGNTYKGAYGISSD